MSDDPYADSVLAPERLGQGAFLVTVPVFAYLGVVLFEDVLFGGLLGLAIGGGTLLYFPYVLRRSVVEDGRPAAAAGRHVRRAAVGLAMTVGGFLAFALRFVFEGALAVPLLVGALVAAVAYVPLSYTLPSLEQVAAAVE